MTYSEAVYAYAIAQLHDRTERLEEVIDETEE
jgi:hypothetical protein